MQDYNIYLFFLLVLVISFLSTGMALLLANIKGSLLKVKHDTLSVQTDIFNSIIYLNIVVSVLNLIPTFPV